MESNYENEAFFNFNNINNREKLEKVYQMRKDQIEFEEVETKWFFNISISELEDTKTHKARIELSTLKSNLELWQIKYKNDLENLKIKYDKRKFELERLKSGDQGQGKKKRKTWTIQEKKQYIEEFIEFRDSKEGKSLEDIKSLWDRNIVLKSDKRIPKASGLKSWIEDGKYTMTSIKKENIPDLKTFVKD